MRLALYGGTFDPIHTGHLTVAREAQRVFSLDRVIFIPNHRPPHKSGGAQASYEDRFRMVELAIAGDAGFDASRLEEAPERSYTIETLLKVRSNLSTDDRLFFLIGADAYADVGTWFRWREVLLLTDFIVVTRPGFAIPDIEGATVHALETLALEISSSDIRRRLAAGQMPRELPPAVARYVIAHRLYTGSP